MLKIFKFIYKKQEKEKLIKWLKGKSKHIDVSNNSIYFTIDNITLRYSDHIAYNSKALINIIRIDLNYIVYVYEYKIPKIFTDVDKVIDFIEYFLLIHKSTHRNLAKPLEEIANEKLLNSFPLKTQHYLLHIHNKLREEVISYIKNNIEDIDKINEFLSKIINKNKEKKENSWKEFIRKQ